MRATFAAAALCAFAGLASGAAEAATVFASAIDVGRSGVAGAGFEATAAAFSTSRDNPANALGAPDQVGDSEGGFFSLGRGGAAVFTFGSDFQGEAAVFEVTFGCSGPQNGDFCNFRETADLYVFDGAYTPFDGAFDLSDLLSAGFTLAAAIPNGLANQPGGATVAIGGRFTALALVDTSTQGGDGFDVDAVSVNAVPLPAPALLLAAGLIGLGAYGRRRARA